MRPSRKVQRKLKRAVRPTLQTKVRRPMRAVRRATVDPVSAEIIRGAMETIAYEMATHVSLTATTPILVLTADATERQEARLLATGATAYVTKPIDVRELLEFVHRTLDDAAAATRTGASGSFAPVDLGP